MWISKQETERVHPTSAIHKNMLLVCQRVSRKIRKERSSQTFAQTQERREKKATFEMRILQQNLSIQKQIKNAFNQWTLRSNRFWS